MKNIRQFLRTFPPVTLFAALLFFPTTTAGLPSQASEGWAFNPAATFFLSFCGCRLFIPLSRTQKARRHPDESISSGSRDDAGTGSEYVVFSRPSTTEKREGMVRFDLLLMDGRLLELEYAGLSPRDLSRIRRAIPTTESVDDEHLSSRPETINFLLSRLGGLDSLKVSTGSLQADCRKRRFRFHLVDLRGRAVHVHFKPETKSRWRMGKWLVPLDMNGEAPPPETTSVDPRPWSDVEFIEQACVADGGPKA